MDEMLTIFDEELNPIGAAPRSLVHQEGLLHEVAHIWVASRIEGAWWLWFQQRAFDKADFPGYYDTAVGGHIAAGEEVLPAAVREMGEEIGLFPQPEALLFVGSHRDEVHIPGFFSREVARVYLYQDDAPKFAPGEEVERMVRIRLEDFSILSAGGNAEAVDEAGNRFSLNYRQFCIAGQEFEALIKPFVAQMR